MQLGHQFLRGRIFHRGIFHLLVLVDGKVVAVGDDFFLGHKEGLFRAGAVLFQIGKAGEDVGNVVLLHGRALVVQRKAVGLHVVEPDIIRAACRGFGEDEHGGRDARIRPEHAGGHGDDGPQLMMLHKFPAYGLMRLAAAEEHAVGHDAGALPALFQNTQKKREKQQFRLFGAGHGFQGVADALGVDAALERRIREAHGERGVHGVFPGHAVPVADIRVMYGVQHEIHGRNAQHGGVGVVAGEGGPGKMFPLLRGHGAFVVCADVFGGGNEKSRRAAGRVADDVVGRGAQKRDHHVADVLGRAELPVAARGGELAEHVFIQIALHVEAGNVVFIQFFQTGDHLFQHLRRGHEKHGVLHEMSKGRLCSVVVTVGQVNEGACFLVEVRQFAALHFLDGRKNALRNDVEYVLGVFVLEFAPAHGLAEGRLREDFFDLHAERFIILVFQLFDIQRADEHEVCQLFNDGERIGQTRGKDVEPDFIDFIFYGTRNHGLLLSTVGVGLPERAGNHTGQGSQIREKNKG